MSEVVVERRAVLFGLVSVSGLCLGAAAPAPIRVNVAEHRRRKRMEFFGLTDLGDAAACSVFGDDWTSVVVDGDAKVVRLVFKKRNKHATVADANRVNAARGGYGPHVLIGGAGRRPDGPWVIWDKFESGRVHAYPARARIMGLNEAWYT